MYTVYILYIYVVTCAPPNFYTWRTPWRRFPEQVGGVLSRKSVEPSTKANRLVAPAERIVPPTRFYFRRVLSPYESPGHPDDKRVVALRI